MLKTGYLWIVRLFGEIIHEHRQVDYRSYRRTNYALSPLICSVGLAHYGVSRAKDWVSVDCGTSERYSMVRAPVRRDNPRA